LSTSFNVEKHPVVLFAQHGYLIGAPAHEEWYQEWLFRTIADSEPVLANRTLWYDGPDTIWFNNWGMRYFGDRYTVGFYHADEPYHFYAQRGAAPAETPAGFTLLGRQNLPDGTVLSLFARTTK